MYITLFASAVHMQKETKQGHTLWDSVHWPKGTLRPKFHYTIADILFDATSAIFNRHPRDHETTKITICSIKQVRLIKSSSYSFSWPQTSYLKIFISIINHNIPLQFGPATSLHATLNVQTRARNHSSLQTGHFFPEAVKQNRMQKDVKKDKK